MTPEKRFENKVKEYLKENNCWNVKYFANRNTKSGIPDVLTCVNGYFVAIETKAQNGKPTELQLYNRRLIRQSGGICIVLYPDQVEKFKELIKGIKERPICKQYISYQEQYQFDRE